MADQKKKDDAADAPEATVTMDERIKNAKGVDAPEAMGVAPVQSVTTALPAESPGSKEVGPSAPDTEPEAPPLHTGKPDEPIAQVLASGSGQHTPPDPEKWDPEGRPLEKGSRDV